MSNNTAAAAAKSLQSCPTLCDPMDGSPPGSPVPGILQGRTLYNDLGINSRERYNNCKYLCTQHRSTSIHKTNTVVATAKSLQSCPTLCDPTDGSPPGSAIPGILQARTLEWVAISFSNAWKWKVKVKSLSCVWLFMTPWTAAYQAPPSMGFSRQEY